MVPVVSRVAISSLVHADDQDVSNADRHGGNALMFVGDRMVAARRLDMHLVAKAISECTDGGTETNESECSASSLGCREDTNEQPLGIDENGNDERFGIQVVVAGDGKARCASGIMRVGQICAASRHDAPAREYVAIDVDGGIAAGAPDIGFSLDVRTVPGMQAAKSVQPKLRLNPKRILRGNKSRDNDLYTAECIAQWCRRNPGCAVSLLRMGAGESLAPYELAVHGVSDVHLGSNTRFDCLKAATVDAVRAVRGINAASVVAKGGTTWCTSLSGITEILAKVNVGVKVIGVSEASHAAIRHKHEWVGFNHFGEQLTTGVFALHLGAIGVQPHTIAIDTKARRVYDKAQPVVLRLSAQVLALICECGKVPTRIVAARRIKSRNRRKEIQLEHVRYQHILRY